LSTELFLSAYSTTSQVMFPILVFIIILLIRDLAKYTKISEKIRKRLDDLSERIEDTGFKRNSNENVLKFIERYLKKYFKD
jgi:uncharacterized protein Smg (DUF494 family)|tara:strand:- start:4275 stop:4517 length:243 start_codon:yes stop_codon:yes gene_type:complete